MEDKEIIALFFKRDEIALKETALKYGKLVFRLADNILHCSEDSRECVNDTYFALWNTIPPNNPDVLVSFICRIARNISIKKLRAKTAKKRSGNNLPVSEIEYELCDYSFEDKIDARALGRKIDSFLDLIDEESRVIFIKRYWFCDEIADIALSVGLSEGTVYQKLSRTRKKLKRYLEKESMI